MIEADLRLKRLITQIDVLRQCARPCTVDGAQTPLSLVLEQLLDYAHFIETDPRLVPEPCVWREDADGNWSTLCREMHVFIEGTPAQNRYRFCPYCGLPMRGVPYRVEDL